jgi:uncharacterized phiE125 gp8 family phage protein
MSLTLITPPAVEPISLTEAKAHLRVDHSDDDAMIQLYIQAARSYVDGEDGFLGRCLVTQTWELTIDAFPDNEIKIPLPPLQSVVSVNYDDSAGNGQSVAASNYYVDVASEAGWVVPVSGFNWPTTLDGVNAVRVQFVAGYAPPSSSPIELTANVPAAIKAGMLLMIGAMFERREDADGALNPFVLPTAAHYLFRPFRVQLGMA